MGELKDMYDEICRLSELPCRRAMDSMREEVLEDGTRVLKVVRPVPFVRKQDKPEGE